MEIEQASPTDILTPRNLSLLGILGAGALIAACHTVEAADNSPLNTKSETVWQSCDDTEPTSYVADDGEFEICAVLPESNDTENLTQLVNQLSSQGTISEATIYITDPELNHVAARERSNHRSSSDEIEDITNIQAITGLTVREEWVAGAVHDQPVTRFTLKDW